MTKLRTRHPAEYDGPLKEINRLFVRRLMRFIPRDMGLKDFLNKIFHYSTRDIDDYIATRTFFIRGDYLERPENRIQGYGKHRRVPKGALVLIREDATLPNVVELEVFIGPGGRDTVFRLNYDEWQWTRQRLSLVTELELKNGKSKTTVERNTKELIGRGYPEDSARRIAKKRALVDFK